MPHFKKRDLKYLLLFLKLLHSLASWYIIILKVAKFAQTWDLLNAVVPKQTPQPKRDSWIKDTSSHAYNANKPGVSAM